MAVHRSLRGLSCILGVGLAVGCLALPAAAQPEDRPRPGARSGQELDAPRRLPASRGLPASKGVRELRDEAPESLRRWLSRLPAGQRRAAARRLRALPEHERRAAFENWEGMTERERAQAQDRLQQRARRAEAAHREASSERDRIGAARRERLAAMPADERRALRQQLDRWQKMAPGERQGMRRRLEGFSKLTADEQEMLVEEKFLGHSPAERERILRDLRNASQLLTDRAP